MILWKRSSRQTISTSETSRMATASIDVKGPAQAEPNEHQITAGGAIDTGDVEAPTSFVL